MLETPGEEERATIKREFYKLLQEYNLSHPGKMQWQPAAILRSSVQEQLEAIRLNISKRDFDLQIRELVHGFSVRLVDKEFNRKLRAFCTARHERLILTIILHANIVNRHSALRNRSGQLEVFKQLLSEILEQMQTHQKELSSTLNAFSLEAPSTMTWGTRIGALIGSITLGPLAGGIIGAAVGSAVGNVVTSAERETKAHVQEYLDQRLAAFFLVEQIRSLYALRETVQIILQQWRVLVRLVEHVSSKCCHIAESAYESIAKFGSDNPHLIPAITDQDAFRIYEEAKPQFKEELVNIIIMEWQKPISFLESSSVSEQSLHALEDWARKPETMEMVVNGSLQAVMKNWSWDSQEQSLRQQLRAKVKKLLSSRSLQSCILPVESQVGEILPKDTTNHESVLLERTSAFSLYPVEPSQVWKRAKGFIEGYSDVPKDRSPSVGRWIVCKVAIGSGFPLYRVPGMENLKASYDELSSRHALHIRRDWEKLLSDPKFDLFPVTTALFTPIPNPYMAGGPVRSKSIFVGREDVFKFVQDNLRGPGGSHILILQGPRRTGKSSVMVQLKNSGRLQPDIVVYVDMQNFGPKVQVASKMETDGTAMLMELLAEAIQEVLQGAAICPTLNYASYDWAKNPLRAFDRFLKDLQPDLGERHLVLLLDEFEYLEVLVTANQVTSGIFPYLRSLMQHQAGLNFVLAGAHLLEEMRQDYWSILFNITLTRRVGYLAEEDTLHLLHEPVKDTLHYDKTADQSILRLTGGQPFFVQLICHCLVIHMNEAQRSQASAQDVEEIIEDVLSQGSSEFRHLWDLLPSPFYRRVLALIAYRLVDEREYLTVSELHELLQDQGWLAQPDAALRDTLQTLKNASEILETYPNNPGELRFRVDLFRRWLRTSPPAELWELYARATLAGETPASPPQEDIF